MRKRLSFLYCLFGYHFFTVYNLPVLAVSEFNILSYRDKAKYFQLVCKKLLSILDSANNYLEKFLQISKLNQKLLIIDKTLENVTESEYTVEDEIFFNADFEEIDLKLVN